MLIKKQLQNVLPGNRISRLCGDQGTSLLEMALLLPVLLLLILGIIEVGRYAELSIMVANAARSGVQYGAQSLADAADITGIQNAATYDAPMTPPLVVSSSVICYCSGSVCNGPCVAPNTEIVYLHVTTTGTFTSLFAYPGLPSFAAVNSVAQMRVAQ
jgi:Flp pilus assembly protein TadG